MPWADTPDGGRVGLAWAFGQPVDVVLTTETLPAWVEFRTSVCGHVHELDPENCRVCKGTYRVIEAFSGHSMVRVLRTV